MKPTAVDKAFRILDCLMEHPEGLAPAELIRQTGYPPGTLHRLLNTLVRNGFARRDTAGRTYRLGYKFLWAFEALQNELNLHEKALPHLKSLAQATGGAANLGGLQEGQVVIWESIHPDSAGPIMWWPAGTRAPLHSTALGKVLLAHFPEGELQQRLEALPLTACTPHTITSLPQLVEHLERVRQQGYAVDDEETNPGVRCVGAPIYDYKGQVIAAISVTLPAYRLPLEHIPAIAGTVIEASKAISAELGYKPALGELCSRA